jgi:hypothetical protein
MGLREYLSNGNAFWISPKGQMLDCGHSLTHISFVLKNPQKFGLSDDEIKQTRTIQDMSIDKQGIITYVDGVESNAWDNIVQKALKNGFIRARRVKSNKYSYIWYIDIYEFNNRTRKLLSDWAYGLNVKRREDKVIISVSKGNKMDSNLTIKDLVGLSEAPEHLLLVKLDEMENINENRQLSERSNISRSILDNT